jgi:hypothetical protein
LIFGTVFPETETNVNIVAPILTLVLGFLAAWITVKPPSTRAGKTVVIVCFALFTLVAVIGTLVSDRDDKKEKDNLARLAEATKSQTQLLYSQNSDLQTQIDRLRSAVMEAATVRQSPTTEMNGSCLKRDAENQLAKVNAFLKERLAKSPAYDFKMANNPRYSEKEEAYEMETSREYLQKFWPEIQRLLQRAVDASLTPEGTKALATPGWYPEDKWWQAMMKPGYKELALIAQQSANC